MSVLTTPRRMTFYWLLLLLPTLVVGAGALVLLRREQTRIDEQARAAAESRRASIEARARLIAENVELAVGDVEDGLMSTLMEAPTAKPDAFFDDWERTNPLVRATFRVTGGTQLSRPALGSPHAAVRGWLGAWIASGAPWQNLADSLKKFQETPVAQELRKNVESNVAQVQNTRNALKDAASQGGRAGKMADSLATSERSGWMPWRDGSGLHLVGWRRATNGVVVGVEVELAAISSRLGELLPSDGDLANAFAVREAGGVTLQSKIYATGASSFASRTAPQPVATVPIAANLLPGWEVIGFTRDDAARSVGGGFFLVGALLVAIFIAAILAGGSLLLWQARRSEAEAAQKTSFVANVSHEFKTPLTTIRLYAELLEQGRVRDAAQGADYLRTIGRETQRLARLVNNALDFSRLEQGRKKYACETLDLTAELGRLLDTHVPRVAEAGLQLHRQLPSGPVETATDRDALEQIVLNLVDNACKYAAAGGEILVALAPRPAGGVEVRVADRGPGVPPEHHERIFEKFHRVDEALTAEKSGAGLGLSIARQLARGLGGGLRYSSRAGGGAEFILTLP